MSDLFETSGAEKLITIKNFLGLIKTNIPSIGLITGSITLITIFYSLLVTPMYESYAVLTKSAAIDEQVSSSSLSDVATFVGLGDMVESGEQKVAVTRALSRTYFLDRIYRNSFLLSCFLSECDTKNFDRVEDFYSNGDPEVPFGLAYRTYRQVFIIRPNIELVYFLVHHKNPDVAYELLKWMIDDVNNYIRDIQIQKAQNSLDFLTQRLITNQNIEIQKIIAALIQKDYQTLALSQQTKDYAFETIDMPIYPEDRFFPRRTLMVSVAFLGSIFLAISFLVISSYLGLVIHPLNRFNNYFLSKSKNP